MMVETMLECSQDFGMSGGPLPLPAWKREVLQRRAARSRAPPPAPPPAPEPEEELRYGPGIVKRLKSRYLSLALREAPRRRPSVLRRAASLELLEPVAGLPDLPDLPDRPARPQPQPPQGPPARRDSVKRARSVEALSRERDEPRAPRPPRRAAPLLREAERPPPDVVRAALRKFENGAARRPPAPPRPPPAPAAPRPRRVGVIRPMPAPKLERAASVKPATPPASPPPPDPARPSPLEPARPSPPEPTRPSPPDTARTTPPAAMVEPVRRPRPVSPPPRDPTPPLPDKPAPPVISPVIKIATQKIEIIEPEVKSKCVVLEVLPAARAVSVSPPRSPPPAVNGHVSPPPAPASPAPMGRWSRGAPGCAPASAPSGAPASAPPPAAAPRLVSRAAPRPRAPAAATSVVFNFSSRREVPDYIENDGVIRRPSRRDRLKEASEPGVVVLVPSLALAGEESGDEEDGGGGGGEEEMRVRFVNDNVLINGRSSMPARKEPTRQARLKLQFDDSLTITHEYPSEDSLLEDDGLSPSPAPPASPASPASPAAPLQALNHNTHLVSVSLGGYCPLRSCADSFQLGVTRPAPAPPGPRATSTTEECPVLELSVETVEECVSFSAARRDTDLLF